MRTICVHGYSYCSSEDHGDPDDEWRYWSESQDIDPRVLSSKGNFPGESYIDSFESYIDPVKGQNYWYVGVQYATGDTFHNSYGNHEPIDIFETEAEAREAEALIRKVRSEYDKAGNYDYGKSFFELNGRKYGLSMIIGYFERLEDVVVKPLEYRG